MLTSLPQHLAKASLLLVAGIASGFVAARLRGSFSRAIQSVEERSRILGVFGQHVSPEVARRLVASGSASRSELRGPRGVRRRDGGRARSDRAPLRVRGRETPVRIFQLA